MPDFVGRPYKLFNKIQHYDWGTRNESAFIPKLLGIRPEPGTPYAELWIGAHPKAPSEIEVGRTRIGLDEIIARYPREALGEYAIDKFAGKLPFLLKVLSAARALSIQTHPNKPQAVKLHARHPEHYPDENHKPEIAIALDRLSALVGFKPAAKIAETLRAIPEIGEFADEKLLDVVINGGAGSSLEDAIRDLYADIMNKAGEREALSSCIGKIRARLSQKKPLSLEETAFLDQYELYRDDIGLLSFFFFNVVDLKPGQSVFTDAGVPHAYIKGNIVECMANSDNVVRAGLTNKFKDVETLLSIVKYEFAECRIINAEQKTDEVVYNSGAEEFRVTRLSKEAGFKRTWSSNDRPSVWLLTGGEMEVMWKHADADHAQAFSRGESFFVPALLPEFTVFSKSGVECFVVEIP